MSFIVHGNFTLSRRLIWNIRVGTVFSGISLRFQLKCGIMAGRWLKTGCMTTEFIYIYNDLFITYLLYIILACHLTVIIEAKYETECIGEIMGFWRASHGCFDGRAQPFLILILISVLQISMRQGWSKFAGIGLPQMIVWVYGFISFSFLRGILVVNNIRLYPATVILRSI